MAGENRKILIGSLIVYAERGEADIVDALCRKGENVYDSDKNGATALHYSAQKNHVECIRVLVRHGHSIDFTDNDGWTALHYAAAHDCFDAVKCLIELGADVEKMTTYGNTVEQLACEDGNQNIVALLKCAREDKRLNINIRIDDEIQGMIF